MRKRGLVIGLFGAAAVAVVGCGRTAARSDSAIGDSAATAAAVRSHSGPIPDEAPALPTTAPPVAAGREQRPSQAPAAAPPSAGRSDTVRGIIRVVGSAADEQLVVRPNGSGSALTLLGAERPMLARLAGAEVWLAGTRGAMRSFVVDRFLVRAVDGALALDGTLTRRNGAVVLVETGSGAAHPIANPPAALVSHTGARVWITGALDGGAVTFGVIGDR